MCNTHEHYSDLEHVLTSYYGTRQRLARVQCRPLAYHSSFSIQELTVELHGGQMLGIICKDLSASGLLESARHVKPMFLYDPLREIEAYRRILAPSQLGATFYGASVDVGVNRYRLYLERVEGRPLWEIGDFAVWQDVARWLAAFHTSRRAAPYSAHFLRYDQEFYERWLTRAAAFAQAESLALGPALRTFERSIDRLVHMQASVVHGDLYASNILVKNASGQRICPVDWELTAIGPPLIDLASLIAGRWTEDQKMALARTYYSSCVSRAYPAVDYSIFLRDLDVCRLHVAVQWLGWCDEWMPPPEHNQDWVAEAVRVAKRLDG